MRVARVLLALAFVPALASRPARAQSDTSGLRAVADSFFHLLAAERYRDAALLLDLEAFDADRRAGIANARDWKAPRHVTAASLRQQDPDMPRAVAEWQARRINQASFDPGPMLLHEYGVSTIDSLRALDVRDLAAHWLESRDLRAMMRRSIAERRAAGCRLSPAEEKMVLDSLRVSPARIIGTVSTDSDAYVLFERPEMTGPITDMPRGARDSSAVPVPTAPPARAWQVMPPSMLLARRVGGRWVLVPTLDQFASMSFMAGCSARRTAGSGKPAR